MRLEDRLATYIVHVAGGSYVIGIALLLIFMLAGQGDPLGDSLFLSSLILLILYLYSLALVHLSRGESSKTMAVMWSASLVIHIAIMGYILFKFGDFVVLIFMIAESIILAMLLVGLSRIGYRIVKGANQNA